MVFELVKSGKKTAIRWIPLMTYRRPDCLKSSDFPDYTPQFVPSYERACSHNMYDLLGYEYCRQWHREREMWANKMYPHVERSFFPRRYVIRSYQKRCPKLKCKPKGFTLSKYTSVCPRVDARWAEYPKPQPCTCEVHRRKAVSKPTCSMHSRRPCKPCTCTCSVCKGARIIPPVAIWKDPPYVLRPLRPPCCGGLPRGAVGPCGCGVTGAAPCGPAGAPRDRCHVYVREPVCVPSHAPGPNPAWTTTEPCADAPPPCEPVDQGFVCQPPCDEACKSACVKCGCPRPCPCEQRAKEAAEARGGPCAMGRAPGAPCPSRGVGGRVCAEVCGEPCHGHPPHRPHGPMHAMHLPCPCHPGEPKETVRLTGKGGVKVSQSGGAGEPLNPETAKVATGIVDDIIKKTVK